MNSFYGTSVNSKLWIVFIGWIYLHTLRYFDYLGYDPTIGGWMTKIIALFILMYILTHKYNKDNAHSRNYVAGFILVPMLSFIPCWLEHGQDIFTSFNAYLPLFVLFLYYVFHSLEIKKNQIVNLLTLFAVARTAILLLEQFTYPVYWFSFRPETILDNGYVKEIEVRSGILRYYISDTYLSMFLIFYWGQRVMEKFSWRCFMLFVWGIFGLWLDQTRQFMAVGYGAFFVIAISQRGKIAKRIAIVSTVIIALVIVAMNFEFLFGELTAMTGEEITKDNIRFLSYNYYLYDYWGGLLSFIFGNGLAGVSAYGKEMQYNMDVLHLYRSDIGVIGFLNQFGLVSVLFFLWFYFSFARKNWSKFDLYIKMFLLATLLNLPLVVFFVNNLNWYTYMAFMMYLIDMSICKQTFNSLKCIDG